MKMTSEQQQSIEEWMDFLKIPSISADSNFKADVRRAAHWVQQALLDSGCTTVDLIDSPGHPIVYGEYLIDPKLPTVLVY